MSRKAAKDVCKRNKYNVNMLNLRSVLVMLTLAPGIRRILAAKLQDHFSIYSAIFILTLHNRKLGFNAILRATHDGEQPAVNAALARFVNAMKPKGIIATDEEGRYYLTPAGKVIHRELIDYIMQKISIDNQ